MQFRIALKNSKVKSYYLISALIVGLHIAVFILLLFSEKYFYDAVVSLFLLLLYLGLRFYVTRRDGTRFYIDQLTYLILAGSWLVMHNAELVAICLLLGILYHFSVQKIQFLFTTRFIRKTNFPPVTYSWDRMDNVVLRDGVLTIDFNNNKLIQAEIDEDCQVNEREFNLFVKRQLHEPTFQEENVESN